jgi:uncharacterized protein DUF4128
MSIDQVQTAVETFLAANWTATEVAYENSGYTPKADGNGVVLPYVLAELDGGLYEQRSFGAPTAKQDLWLASGTLWLHVFVASGTGSLLAKQYAAQLAELFRGLELNPDIAFLDITLAASGGMVDGDDWGFSVSINWQQG